MIGSNESTQAVARLLDQHNLDSLLRHFQRGGTWDTFGPSKNAIYLEQLKLDLVALAHEIEGQLVEHYRSEDLIDRA